MVVLSSSARSGVMCCTQVALSVDDIEKIVDTLVYDGKLERSVAVDDDRVKLYRAVTSLVESTALMSLPCGVCPVRTCVTVTVTWSTALISLPCGVCSVRNC